MRKPSERWITVGEFALVTLIWGSTWLIIKGQLGAVAPVWSVAYRFIIAAAALAALAVASGRWARLGARGHAFALLVGLCQFALNFNLVYAAEQRLASGLVALVFALLIVPNTLFSAMFFGTAVRPRVIAGAAIGFVGLGLVFAPALATAGVGVQTAAGLGLVATAVICASVGNVVQAGSLARTLPPLPTLATAMGYGAIIDAGVAWTTAGAPVFDPRPEYWAGLIYLSLAASVVAFSLYYRLIRRIGAGPAAYTSVVVPVFALILSTIFEHYQWTLLAAGGAALALAGLVVALGGLTGTRAGHDGSRRSAE